MSIHTILGAGGIVAHSLALELINHHIPVRLVSRHPAPRPGVTTQAADLTDPGETLEAIRNASVVYLCVGLKYDYTVWRHQWPAIIENTMSACRQTGAKLIFFDNAYMYGKVQGLMTEETPYNPFSRKGDLRARIATRLMSEVRKGNITASIARAADFYGPGASKTSIPNLLVFQRLITGRRAQWLVNANVKHSFTYTGDIAKALYLLASDENSWNQAWHLPTATHPLTGLEFVSLAARALHKNSRLTVLPEWQIRLAGLFDRSSSELVEMLYQNEYDYIFDSSKFVNKYNFLPTPYQEGIKATANAYTSDIGL
jgi:nucleoside-diphosphate-sugar epimerase